VCTCLNRPCRSRQNEHNSLRTRLTSPQTSPHTHVSVVRFRMSQYRPSRQHSTDGLLGAVSAGVPPGAYIREYACLRRPSSFADVRCVHTQSVLRQLAYSCFAVTPESTITDKCQRVAWCVQACAPICARLLCSATARIPHPRGRP